MFYYSIILPIFSNFPVILAWFTLLCLFYTFSFLWHTLLHFFVLDISYTFISKLSSESFNWPSCWVFVAFVLCSSPSSMCHYYFVFSIWNKQHFPQWPNLLIGFKFIKEPKLNWKKKEREKILHIKERTMRGIPRASFLPSILFTYKRTGMWTQTDIILTSRFWLTKH